MKGNDSKAKDGRKLWTGNEKGDYRRIREELCIKAESLNGPKKDNGHVTKHINGFLVTLCCHCIQGADELSVPVDKSTAASWNVPLDNLIREAVENTTRIFPATAYDTVKRKKMDLHSPDNCLYDLSAEDYSEAAEEILRFRKEEKDPASPVLRFIVNASPLIGEGLLFYKHVLYLTGRITRCDPVIISVAPGKLYIFSPGDDSGSILTDHLNRYMERFGDAEFIPHIYRYHRSNHSLSDMSPGRSLEGGSVERIKIPPDSVSSAWGDLNKRRELLEWKKKEQKKLMDQVNALNCDSHNLL